MSGVFDCIRCVSMAISHLSSQARAVLTSIIDNAQLFADPGLDKWTGTQLLHLQVQSRWSQSFDAVLIDRGLNDGLGFQEVSGCQPKEVCQVQVRFASPPPWELEVGRQFACRAVCVIQDGLRYAYINNPFDVWMMGHVARDSPTNWVHAFCGAFHGWNQAVEGISAIMGHDVQSVVSIDIDREVCKQVDLSVGSQVIVHPFAKLLSSVGTKLVVCCDIAQSQWQSAVHRGENLLWTGSFPCQPYSCANTNRLGMESPSGRAILFLLKSAKIMQPLAIFLENVEGIRSHPHMSILKRFITWAGFKVVWSQSSCLSEISHCFRKRWLAVLIRQDLIQDAPEGFGTFRLGGCDIVGWNEPDHQWNLPTSMNKQLIIDENLWPSYGCRELLPSQRQERVVSDSPVDVLRARIPSPHEPLATLVASYGTQHLLSSQQLKARGIFADVVESDHQQFSFLDPVMWMSLLGCTQSTFLPADVTAAFAHVGNSIAVPQAALAVMVGLHATKLCDPGVSIKGTVMKLWQQRLNASNSVCVEVPSGFALFTINDYLLLGGVQRCPPSVGGEDFSITITWPDQVFTNVAFRQGDRVGDVLQKLHIHDHLLASWGVWDEDDLIFRGASSELPSRDLQGVLAFTKSCERDVSIVPTIEDSTCDSPLSDEGRVKGSEVSACVKERHISFFVRMIDDSVKMVCATVTTTFQQVLEMIGCDEPLDAIALTVNHVGVSMSAVVDEMGGKTLTLCRSNKKIRLQPRAPLLEVVMLDGTTRFIPASDDWSIRYALQVANLHECLIEKLVPLHNGNRVSLDELLSNLDSPHVRLACYPLNGGKGKGKGKSKAAVDPLQLRDPWANSAPAASGCRWDQLLLPEKHQFFCKTSGKRIIQIPLGQLSNQHGGIVFATRAALQELVQFAPPTTTVLLIPGFRGILNFSVPDPLKVCDPMQITVKEPSDASYKRLVIPILLKGEFQAKYEDAATSIPVTSVKFVELVVEMHENVMSKASIDAMHSHPLACFKKALTSSKTALVEYSVYSYRNFKFFDHATVHQAIIRVPRDAMDELLRFSGLAEVFVRQFIQPGDDPSHSILPRYFPINWDDLRAATQLAQAMGEYGRGIALTKKGCALRADNSRLSDARSLVLLNDIRFCDLNRGVVAKKTYLAQGYPFELSHQALIESTHKALQLAPIPLRSFRVGGLHTWALAFDAEPKTTTFSLSMDDVVYEVVLTPQQMNKPNPGKSKQKTKLKPVAMPQPSMQHVVGAARLNTTEADVKVSALEVRVAKLETQQSMLAEKVDNRFDQVQSQLQQVLAAVIPQPGKMNVGPGPTGDSPPPKVPRAK